HALADRARADADRDQSARRRGRGRRRTDHVAARERRGDRAMKRIAVAVLLISGVAHAEEIHPDIVEKPPPSTKWMIEILYDQGFFSARGVEPDGRHIGIAWTREPPVVGPVVVLRRKLDDHADVKGHAIRVTDPGGNALIPAFLYPSSKEY